MHEIITDHVLGAFLGTVMLPHRPDFPQRRKQVPLTVLPNETVVLHVHVRRGVAGGRDLADGRLDTIGLPPRCRLALLCRVQRRHRHQQQRGEGECCEFAHIFLFGAFRPLPDFSR